MTKELSKQLCELCGVEAKYKTIGRWLSETDDGYKARRVKGTVYPDFGEPENFVKLGEMRFNYNFDTTVFSSFCNEGFKDRTSMLLSIVDYFERFKDDSDIKQQWFYDFKQQIREAEWKYE